MIYLLFYFSAYFIFSTFLEQKGNLEFNWENGEYVMVFNL